MKRLVIAFFTLLLLPPMTSAQILPDAPAAPPDPAWNRLYSLAVGQSIVITTTDNRLIHCLFGSVTDAWLFCNPPGNPAGVGFRFDRSDIASEDNDRTSAAPTQARKTERTYHPAWISSMIAGGLIVGIIAAQNTDAGHAARDGLIGAVVVGAIGAPFAFLPGPFSSPPYGGPIYGMSVRLRASGVTHPHRVFHLR
jgi:hypothetical protein